MAEQASALDERIRSWLQDIEHYDAFTYRSPNVEEEHCRPCMNCSMRGGRTRPNLWKMEIPRFILPRPRKPVSKKPSAAMTGVKRDQQRPERGKGRGRTLKEKETQISDTSDVPSESSGEYRDDGIALFELSRIVDNLSNVDLVSLWFVSGFARQSKRGDNILRERLKNPPKEVSLNCWSLMIQISLDKKPVDILMDLPFREILATCVALEADKPLYDVLTERLDDTNVAYVMFYMTQNSWLSSDSGEYVCSYLHEYLDIPTEAALNAMRTASGGYGVEGLEDLVQLVAQSEDYCDTTSASISKTDKKSLGRSKKQEPEEFGHPPPIKHLEIDSKEEFPDLSSSVTVKKNINTAKDDQNAAETSEMQSSGFSSDRDDRFSDVVVTSDLPKQFMVMSQLPSDCTENDLKGALSAFGTVTKVEKGSYSTKIWFDDPSSLAWAVQAMNEINPLTGAEDENIKCVIEGSP